MPSPMPEFEMPAELPSPSAETASAGSPAPFDPAAMGALAAAASPTRARHPDGAPPVRATPPGLRPLDAADLTGEREASDARRASRTRLSWRALVVAGMIGALIGASVPASVQGLERAAAAAELASLRSLASDYLTAIAERRADDSTALAPATEQYGVLAPAAVLAAARPIEDLEVRTVQREGDIASIAVRFRVGAAGHLERTLDAERIDGRWLLTSTLLERVTTISYDAVVAPEIAGFPIASARTLLYPGEYAFDAASGAVLQVSGDRFTVDGDPRTPVEAYVMSGLVPEVAELAMRYASLVAPVCDASASCAGEEGAALSPVGDALVDSSSLGAVEVMVPMTTGSASDAAWVEVPLRIVLDEHGAPAAWECAQPGAFPSEFAPCPALG